MAIGQQDHLSGELRPGRFGRRRRGVASFRLAVERLLLRQRLLHLRDHGPVVAGGGRVGAELPLVAGGDVLHVRDVLGRGAPLDVLLREGGAHCLVDEAVSVESLDDTRSPRRVAAAVAANVEDDHRRVAPRRRGFDLAAQPGGGGLVVPLERRDRHPHRAAGQSADGLERLLLRARQLVQPLAGDAAIADVARDHLAVHAEAALLRALQRWIAAIQQQRRRQARPRAFQPRSGGVRPDVALHQVARRDAVAVDQLTPDRRQRRLLRVRHGRDDVAAAAQGDREAGPGELRLRQVEGKAEVTVAETGGIERERVRISAERLRLRRARQRLLVAVLQPVGKARIARVGRTGVVLLNRGMHRLQVALRHQRPRIRLRRGERRRQKNRGQHGGIVRRRRRNAAFMGRTLIFVGRMGRIGPMGRMRVPSVLFVL